MPIYPNGFLPFGTDDSSIVVQEDLKSQPVGSTLVGTDTSAINFNNDGVLLNTLNSGILIPAFTTQQIADFDVGFNISMMVESGLLSNRPTTADEYLFYTDLAGSMLVSVKKAKNSGWFTAPLPGGVEANIYATVFQYSKPAKTRIDISGDSQGVTVYTDHLKSQVFKWTNGVRPASAFTRFHIGGQGGYAGGPYLHRISDFQVGARPIMLSVIPLTQDVIMLGHSFAYGSSYRPVASTNTSIYSDTGGTPDVSMGSELHRGINKLGVDIGGGTGLKSFGISGSSTSTLVTQITNAQAAFHSRPTFVYIISGANDIQPIASTSATLDTLFTINYQSAIDALIALNPDVRIVIADMPAVSNLALKNTAGGKANWEGGNTRIWALEAANANNVIVSKVSSLFGTHDNPNVALFNVGDLHPNQEGYSVFGSRMADDQVVWFK